MCHSNPQQLPSWWWHLDYSSDAMNNFFRMNKFLNINQISIIGLIYFTCPRYRSSLWGAPLISANLKESQIEKFSYRTRASHVACRWLWTHNHEIIWQSREIERMWWWFNEINANPYHSTRSPTEQIKLSECVFHLLTFAYFFYLYCRALHTSSASQSF